jgi:predicted transcriptional regulator
LPPDTENVIDVKRTNSNKMKKLTNKEREVMELFWQHGPMFVRELLEHYEEPRPHFNTLSTIVRRLEHEGYIGHKQYGSTYQYHALITEQDYAKGNIFRLVDDYIEDSYKGLVSTFLKEEKLSVDELRELISQVEAYEKEKQ